MTERRPIYLGRDESLNPSALAEFKTGDTLGVLFGGTGTSSLEGLIALLGVDPDGVNDLSSLLLGSSGGWEGARLTVGSLSSGWSGASSTVFDNSSSWAGGGGDHSVLSNLSANDHPQYVLSATNADLSSVVEGVSSTVFDNSSAWGAGGGATDHSGLLLLSANDHPQYVLSATNTALSSLVTTNQANSEGVSSTVFDNSSAWAVDNDTTDHGAFTGLDDDDHPQYMLSSTYDPALIGEQLVGLTATQVLTNKSIDASANTIANIGLSSLNTNLTDTMKFANAAYLDSPQIDVSSNGSVINLGVSSTAGDIRVILSGGVYTFDATPKALVALTAGTDTSPQMNYVYILDSTKALTVSVSDWPSAHHAPIATVLCQSAASVQTDGPYKVHAWTDHMSSNNTGHLAHLNFWVRQQAASWRSGALATPTITTNGGSEDNIDLATAAGEVLQLHKHTFPAFDTATGSEVYIVNKNGAAYTKVTDLNAANEDDAGSTISTNNWTNLVVWGVVNESTGDCKLFLNLPSAFHTSLLAATTDAEAYSNYTIPADYTGVGFLIARLTFKYTVVSGGTWTLAENLDLRSTGAAGGGAVGSTEFPDNVFRVLDQADTSKELAFEVSSLTTATTRTITMPDSDVDLGDIDTHAASSTVHFTEASIDHGAISGLGDNDHPQYVLSATNTTLSSLVTTNQTNSEGVSSTVFDNSAAWAVDTGDTTDHGAFTGLDDNDHPQYVLSATNNSLSSLVATNQANSEGVSSTVFDNSASWGAGGGATNLSIGPITTTTVDIDSDTGTDATIPAAVATTAAGLLTGADKAKLDGIESGADVTDTANVTAAGALMDSEVDADIKTLVLPASTTISTFGASLVDDANASAARTTLGVEIGTDVQAYVETVGTSFPVSPSEGDKYYRTDLEEGFYYDSSRSKWLGEVLYTYQGAYLGTRTNGYDYLDANQITYSAALGHVALVDVCIVGATLAIAQSSTCTMQLRDDGVSVATLSVTSSALGATNTLNSATIAANSAISIYMSGTATGGHVGVFHGRRVAT